MDNRRRLIGHDKNLYAVERSAVRTAIEHMNPEYYEYFWS
jgi:hypothetical protein